MAAAYAAVVSLTQIIDQVQAYHTRQLIFGDEQQTQMKNLKEKVSCMQEFLESYSDVPESLPSQIAVAAYEAEDILESHIVEDIHYRSSKEAATLTQLEIDKDQMIDHFSKGLQKVIEDMDIIMKEIMEIKNNKPENLQLQHQQFRDPASDGSLKSAAAIDKEIVGFDRYLEEVKDKLVGSQPYLILQITGMGGIGKTTLAKNVYDDPFIRKSFDYRGWITLSQEFNVREKLLGLLHDFKVSISETEQENLDSDKLGNKLYQHLSKRKYLIVLDDLWSLDAFEKIKRYLANNVGSRIMVTTRQSYVGKEIRPSSFHEIDVLDEEMSWELLCRKAFFKEDCPIELMDVGKEIARNCKGLPLSLAVIAGHLRSKRTREDWENVAKQTNKFVNLEDNERCRKTLSLSYSQMPIHLKPCFLYMGVFPEDHTIRASELFLLWVAEGFLKPRNDKSLQEVAEDYLNDLIDRNLVFARKLGAIGDLKACQIHDVLRDFCLTEGEKERFLCNIDPNPKISQDISNQRRIVIHGRWRRKEAPERYLQSASLARSLSFNFQWDSSIPLPFKLMRVWNSNPDRRGDTGDVRENIFQLINLRCLITRRVFLPKSIDGMLWNLQTLIADEFEFEHTEFDSYQSNYQRISTQIWASSYLRHVNISPEFLGGTGNEQDDRTIFANLQTLWTTEFRCTEEVLRRIPNVEKLITRISLKDNGLEYHHFNNLCRFEKLHSLKLFFSKHNRCPRTDFLQNIEFPRSLKKLYLRCCRFNWDDITTKIGWLPNLEKLTIERGIEGKKWKPVKGDFFLRLKFLKISVFTLVYWKADKCHFPRLEQLVLYIMPMLVEIPSGIGEIVTLRKISMERCLDVCNNSAMTILKQRRRVTEKELNVVVDGKPVVVDDDDDGDDDGGGDDVDDDDDDGDDDDDEDDVDDDDSDGDGDDDE